MNALSVSFLASLIILVLFAPKKVAVVSILGGVLFLTQNQVIDVFGIDMTAIRCIELAAFFRVIIRKEISHVKFNNIDRAFFLTYSVVLFAVLLRSDPGMTRNIGTVFDVSFCYMAFRALLTSVDDFTWVISASALLLIPYLCLLLVEFFTGENPFSAMGAKTWAVLREGKIRAMGSFRNPSILGTLGAAFLPLFLCLALEHKTRALAFVGIIVSVGIILLANSGGPLISAIAGVCGFMCWRIREKLYLVRRIGVAVLILLALFMKAPLWYLPFKLSALTGGHGWHRAQLMDAAIRDFDRWWFLGMEIQETRGWLPYTLEATGGADITNNYVKLGLDGGLFALLLLITTIFCAFRALGSALKSVRCSTQETTSSEYVLWGLGCALLVHVVTWFSITYFDQFYVVWILHLAAIASITDVCKKECIIGTFDASKNETTTRAHYV